MSPAVILDYWFRGVTPAGALPDERLRLWFGGAAETDQEIRERFGAAVEEALRGGYELWRKTPRGTLALILLLDQFTRNIYRGTADAYAGDHRALQLCREGRLRGDERSLTTIEKAFFFLPLEHAEDRQAQQESVQAFTELLAKASPAQQETCRSFLDYAVRHRDIIERFGRFPHRNRALCRPSTPVEKEFLKQPGSSF